MRKKLLYSNMSIHFDMNKFVEKTVVENQKALLETNTANNDEDLAWLDVGLKKELIFPEHSQIPESKLLTRKDLESKLFYAKNRLQQVNRKYETPKSALFSETKIGELCAVWKEHLVEAIEDLLKLQNEHSGQATPKTEFVRNLLFQFGLVFDDVGYDSDQEGFE